MSVDDLRTRIATILVSKGLLLDEEDGVRSFISSLPIEVKERSKQKKKRNFSHLYEGLEDDYEGLELLEPSKKKHTNT